MKRIGSVPMPEPNPVGRPRLIDSPEEMLAVGQAYFDLCREKEQPILVTGLVLALGMSCRDTLIEYAKRPEFTDTVKALKTVCENFAETRLYGSNPTGAIFALKNYGWTDKTQQELSGPDGGPVQASVMIQFVKASE